MASVFDIIFAWLTEGRVLPFLWVALGGLLAWLLISLGHYAAQISADANGRVPMFFMNENTGETRTDLIDKHQLQSNYRPWRYPALFVFVVGCIGMAISAFNAA